MAVTITLGDLRCKFTLTVDEWVFNHFFDLWRDINSLFLYLFQKMLSFFSASPAFSSVLSIICCLNAFRSFWVLCPELNLFNATFSFFEIVLFFKLRDLRLVCNLEAFSRVLLLNSLGRKDNAVKVLIYKVSALLIDVFELICNAVLLIVNGGFVISFLVSVI